MADNPFLEGAPARTGKVTVEMLHDLAERSNQMQWVIDSGKPYFVSRIANGDGTFRHLLDR